MSRVLARLEEDLRAEVGVRLFTVLAWLPSRRVLHRVYTSHPSHYPVGGEKSVEVAAGWLRQCIDEGRPFLGVNRKAVREVFIDHVVIDRLGCGAVINLPVLADCGVVGVINLLDAEGVYDEDSVRRAEKLAPAAAAALEALVRKLEGASRCC
ncbi:GAF domain-containing protein [Allokutzneria sp. A3M-2-11 16]|uniref:GAF domain-containing protein n=1 Tax=Allokutzneria sp. A3M-2-11 16 TaxID=2962043 RepID=UPI0020B7C6BF|nr:GAF domain-containing protein [Allokutzneria sp. A3M-2-11 16]MCP3805493.1 GAF domain-containing protein [Allokutzneria sp. A3M-2-11 16]